jgi:hypothetical protein
MPTPKAPAQITLDIDAIDDPLHGHQEGRFFHGYYDCYCYLPLYVFCGRHLLAAKLRRSDSDAAAGTVEELTRLVGQIRARWPRVRILLRSDSGLAGSCFCGRPGGGRAARCTLAGAVVEIQRLQGGRVMQRHVLYLGEISPSQATAWRKSIEVFDEDAGGRRTLALFPEDRCAALAPDSSTVQLRLSQMRLCRPPAMGRLLAGRAIVGRVATGSLLVRASAGQPQGHTVGSGLAGAGVVPAARTRQRVEAAP